MKLKVTTKHHSGKATIFKNQFLESLTKSNLKVNIVYGIVILTMIYIALFKIKIHFFTFFGIFTFAILFWTFAEYILHRFLFHWISDNKLIQRFHFIMHGSHHLYPRDTDSILMPPVPGLIMTVFLFLIFYLFFSIIGISEITWAFYPGFFLGYILYSFLHRATHVNRPPKKFKYLWKHHIIHHYKYPQKAFGDSTTFWDKVFGSMPPQ